MTHSRDLLQWVMACCALMLPQAVCMTIKYVRAFPVPASSYCFAALFFFFFFPLSLGMSKKNKWSCSQPAPRARASRGGSRVKVGGCSPTFLREAGAQLSPAEVTQVGAAGPSAGLRTELCWRLQSCVRGGAT